MKKILFATIASFFLPVVTFAEETEGTTTNLSTASLDTELNISKEIDRKMDSIARVNYNAPWSKKNWTWMHSNPNVPAYKAKDDLTFVGVPIFIAGIIAKGEKKSFRQNTEGNKHTLVTDFKTHIDDYSQFFGPAMATGLKIGGVEGRSTWGRYLASSAFSYAIMAGLVNSIKYTAKEMRPDGSTANSWPSGHTATAFVGATILHKEYGMTVSPWYSVAGYGVATATGIMRVLNNRHWVSDVLSGAGIGIVSTELGYALGDIIFKNKGLLRGPLNSGKNIIYNPSFFSVSMGAGFGSKSLDFDLSSFELSTMFDDENPNDKILNLRFGTSTAVGVEGAYFFNKYIGVGGRLRVNSAPIKGWSGIEDIAWNDIAGGMFNDPDLDYSDAEIRDFVWGTGTPGQPGYSAPIIDELDFTIKSDHLTEFSADLGLYFNFPLSKRFALGTKLLVGRSIMQEVDLNATVTGGKREFVFVPEEEKYKIVCLPETYTSTWDYFTLGGNNSTKYGTGISLTYQYKENYAWRIFLDYDFTRKKYTLDYSPGNFVDDAIKWPTVEGESLDADDYTEHISIKKNRNTFIFGGSFTISF